MSQKYAPPLAAAHSAPSDVEPRQYTLRGIIGVWATAALPLAVLAWLVAPALAGTLEGPAAWPRALLGCMTAGLVWQASWCFCWSGARPGPCAGAPWREPCGCAGPAARSPAAFGGRVWWVLLPAVLVVGVEQLIPSLPTPASRDLGVLLRSSEGQEFLSGNWPWFAVIVLMALFNTVLGEELLFRGLLLPRMRGVFGRADWLANGILFAAYHLHMPWAMPKILLDSLALAYPTRRYRSAWLGIIVHSLQSVLIVGGTLAVVLR